MDFIKGRLDTLFKKRADEDFVDRQNNATTPFFLFSAAILVAAKEYGPISEPLYCWSQAEFNDEWMQYAHDYCFVESTYHVPPNQSMPMRGQRNHSGDRVSYYQWVPLILIAMAFAAQIPHYFWRFCNSLSHKNLPGVLRQASDALGKEREALVAAGIGRHLHLALLASADNSDPMLLLGKGEMTGGKRKRGTLPTAFDPLRQLMARNWLTLAHMLTKVLYAVLNVSQLMFISFFLGVHRTPKWAWNLLDMLLSHGSAWERSGLFPRVSFCDFTIRLPNDQFQDLTMQCVLSANFLNEKIFLTLYYWFLCMCALSALNFVQWMWTLTRSNTRFVRDLAELSYAQLYPEPEEEDMALSRILLEEEHLYEMPVEHKNVHRRVANMPSNATVTTRVGSTETTSNGSASSSSSSSATVRFSDVETSSVNPSPMVESIPSPLNGQAVSYENIREQAQEKRQKEEADEKFVAVLQKREDLNAAFHAHKRHLLDLLRQDGILAFKLMVANTNLQLGSRVMGELLVAHVELCRASGETAEKA